MQRGSFFKSLATLIVAPKILSQIDWTKAISKSKPPTNTYFNDLQILIPEWYPELAQKYGNENFMTLMEGIGNADIKEPFKFHYLNTKTGEMHMSNEPISATITL